MKKSSFQKLRLREFNQFDIERILKENITTLESRNDDILILLQNSGENLPNDVMLQFISATENNAAESIYDVAVTYHSENIYSFFNGPLFRKDRAAK